MVKKKWLFRSLAVIPIWVIYSWLSGPSGLINQYRIYQQNCESLQVADSLQQVKVRLDSERSRLRNDTLYLEKIIRKELGMAKKEEQVYVLYTQTSSP